MSSGTSVGSTAEAVAGIGSASGGAGAGDGGGSGTGTSIAAGGSGGLAGGAGSLVGAEGCAGMASRDTLPGRRESGRPAGMAGAVGSSGDRKSTRLNSSHLVISYAVFCLKKKKRDGQ